MADLAAEHRARSRAEVKLVTEPQKNFTRGSAAADDAAAQHRNRATLDPKPIVVSNRNFVRGSASGLTASEVIGAQLGNFATGEQIEFLATQHELKTGQAVKRDGESKTAYEKRAKEMAKGAKPGLKLVMDPGKASRMLAKMEKAYRTRVVNWDDEADAAKTAEDIAYMNALRGRLGMPEYDYRNDVPPDVTQVDHERYLKFQKAEVGDRLAACRVSKDAVIMRLVAIHDADAAVRAAAESRYAELLVSAR